MVDSDRRRTFISASLAGATTIATGVSNAAPATPANRLYNSLVTPQEFGATADGRTDDTEAFRRALIAAEGRALWVPAAKQPYLISQTLEVPTGTAVVGESRLSSRILFNGQTALFHLGQLCTLSNLHLDGRMGAGEGVRILGRTGQQIIDSCHITGFEGSCIAFEVGAGSGFYCGASLLYRRSAAPGSGRHAIVIEDAPQPRAVPRKFVGIETGGQCSIRLGGSNSTYISDSFLADIEYSRHTSAALITNCRIATTTALGIKGGQNSITGCDIYPTITLMEGAGGCVIGPNAYNNPPVIDRSGNSSNLVYFAEQPFVPTLSSATGTIAARDAILSGSWSRQGSRVFGHIRCVTGPMTILGTGKLRFSLPHKTNSNGTQVCGQVRIVSDRQTLHGVVICPPGADYLEAESDSGRKISAVDPSHWGPGTIFELSFSYDA